MKSMISYFEIPATDFDRAVGFYRNIFEVEIRIFDWGKEKMGCFPDEDGRPTGAISLSEGFKPSQNGVLLSLNAGVDLNAVLKRIEENGGEIVKPKTKIEAEGMGFFALFMDSEGNRLGLYSEN